MVSLVPRDVLRQFLALQIKAANRLCERCNGQLFPVTMTTYSKYSAITRGAREILSQQNIVRNEGHNYRRADICRPLLPVLHPGRNGEMSKVVVLKMVIKRMNVARRQVVRGFSTSETSSAVKKVVSSRPPLRNLQKQVLLFNADETLVGKMTLARAEGKARTNGLKLIDMGVNQDKEDCYKLLTGQEYFKESMKMRLLKTVDKKREEKEFRMTTKISDHDLEIKLNQIREILQKGRSVKISVTGNKRMTETETTRMQSSLMKKITEGVLDIATVKKAVRAPTVLTFVLVAIPQQEPS